MRVRAIFLPLAGAALGAVGAAIFIFTQRIFPAWLSSLLTVAFWAVTAGIPHETGKRSKPRMIAMAAGILARWVVLDHLATDHVWEALIASQAAPRAAMVALAWISRPSAKGLAFSAALSTPVALAAIAQGVAAAFLCGARPGVLILAGGYVIVRAAQMYFYRRRGGIDLDSLGLAEQLMEIYALALFACRDCT